MAETISARLTARQGRRFGVTVGVAFLVLAAVLWWRDRETGAVVVASIGGMLVAVGAVAPTALLPVERAWMALARAISKVTTPIVMGIVYFLVILPIGLSMRILKRSPLAVKATNDSFWVPRAGEEDRRGGMKHQF